jgi:hypothetical protein
LVAELEAGLASSTTQLASVTRDLTHVQGKMGTVIKKTEKMMGELEGLQAHISAFKERILGRLAWLHDGGIGTYIGNKLSAYFPSQRSVTNVVYQHILEPIDNLQASLHAQIEDLNTAVRDHDVSALLSSIVGFFNTLLNVKYVAGLLHSIMTIVTAVVRTTGKLVVKTGGVLVGAAQATTAFTKGLFSRVHTWYTGITPEETGKVATELANHVDQDEFAAAHSKVFQAVDEAAEFARESSSASPESPDVGAKSKMCTQDIARGAIIGKYRTSAMRTGIAAHGIKFLRSSLGKVGKMATGATTTYDLLVAVPSDVQKSLGLLQGIEWSAVRSAAHNLVSYGGRLWETLETVCSKITTVFTVMFRFIGKHKVSFGVAAVVSSIVLSFVGSLESAKFPGVSAALVTVRKVGGWIAASKLFSVAAAVYRFRSQFKAMLTLLKVINFLAGLVGVGVSGSVIAPLALGIVAAHAGYKFYKWYAKAGNSKPLEILAQPRGITVNGSPSTIGRTLRFMTRGVGAELNKAAVAETLEIQWARTAVTRTKPHSDFDVSYEMNTPREPIVGVRSVAQMLFSESRAFINSAILRLHTSNDKADRIVILPLQETAQRVFDATPFVQKIDRKYAATIVPVAVVSLARDRLNRTIQRISLRVFSITPGTSRVVTFLNDPKDGWELTYPTSPSIVQHKLCDGMMDEAREPLAFEELLLYQIYMLLLPAIPSNHTGGIRSPTHQELEMIRSCFM